MDGFVKVPCMFLVAAEPLRVSIHVHMPSNKTLVLFRKKEAVLTLAEVMSLSKTPSRIMTPAAEYEEAMRGLVSEINSDIAPDGAVGVKAQAIAGALMKSMGSTLTKDPELSRSISIHILDDTTEMLSRILNQRNTLTGGKSYEEFLASLGKEGTPVLIHNRHVSALSALVMLSLDRPNMQNVTDVAYAGLAHDLCLDSLPEVYLTKHLGGEDLSARSLRLVQGDQVVSNYNEHIDLVLSRLQGDSSLTQGAAQAIAQHHENFDGDGLNGLMGPAICFPARVLRIADDLVAMINSTSHPRTLKEAFDVMLTANAKAQPRPYDPAVLSSVQRCLFV